MRRQLFALLLLSVAARGQQEGAPAEGILSHGPMLGSLSHKGASVWARARAEGPLELVLENEEGAILQRVTRMASEEGDRCLRFELSGLAADRAYTYRLLGKQGAAGPFALRTAAPAEQERGVRLAFGSCVDERRFTRQPIWQSIARASPAALVLLGDAPYIDSTELEVQRARYRALYAVEGLASLFAQVPLYATWDDHDFGRNDTTGDLPGKRDARQAFMEYHANPSHGAGGEGIYTSFRRGPMEVFLIDTRWFAATGPSPVDAERATLLGAAQLEWLRAGLRASTAPFKVLASGMIWNGSVRPGKQDHWGTYAHERDALFAFIGEEKIEGVVLVGGDIHRSRALRHDTGELAGYPLFEFISSPLANLVIAAANQPHPGLLVDLGEPSCALLLTAEAAAEGARLEARFIDADGGALWSLELDALDLRAPR